MQLDFIEILIYLMHFVTLFCVVTYMRQNVKMNTGRLHGKLLLSFWNRFNNVGGFVYLLLYVPFADYIFTNKLLIPDCMFIWRDAAKWGGIWSVG